MRIMRVQKSLISLSRITPADCRLRQLFSFRTKKVVRFRPRAVRDEHLGGWRRPVNQSATGRRVATATGTAENSSDGTFAILLYSNTFEQLLLEIPM